MAVVQRPALPSAQAPSSALLFGLVGMLCCEAGAASPAEQPLLTIPLLIRVAQCPGPAKGARSTKGAHSAKGTQSAKDTEPTKDAARARRAVQPAAWIDAHLAAAREILRPHRIELAVERDTFEPRRCELLDRSQRNAMARHASTRREVVVLVTGRIRDLDVPSYNLMGVHWRYGGGRKSWRGRRWVFLTARARPPVLAHELAHYFGVRHDPEGGNLMAPGPSDPRWRRPGPKPKPFAPRLTAAQAERLRRGIGRFMRRARKHKRGSRSAEPKR